MKKWLQDNLSFSTKFLFKRLLVSSVGSVVGLGTRSLNLANCAVSFAAKHGLDIHRVWDVKVSPRPQVIPTWSAPDCLSLMEGLAEKASAKQTTGESIRTSIIVPVFNKVDYTFQCLSSLLREIDFNDTEVIIINNASTDETSQVLSHFGDFLRVIDNEENKGFGDACNQGAAVARGKYLLLLNNDTVVLDGWLKHLLDTVESDDSVGAAGSLFLYPDGSIQEAGAIVWKTGETFHYGWGKSPEDRRYNFAREVDYCSGASLLIRKEIFERLGGFDRRYAPAYYEDVDLCFGVRALGYKVVYQPSSRLIHFEGVTAGTDTRTGVKHFQAINRHKFFEKWRELLEQEQFDNSEALAERAANRKPGPAIIVFDDRVPTPDRDAGSARMFFILKSLAKRSRTVFLYNSNPLGPEYENLLWKEGVETAQMVNYVRLLRDGPFEVAILSRPEIAKTFLRALRRRKPGIKIIFDMVDAYFVRFGREHEITQDANAAVQAGRYKKLELELARSSDLVWCASSADKKTMRLEVSEVPIEVIPTIHPLRSRGKSFAERDHLFFCGHFAHRPNADGVKFFLEEILPLVKRSIPGIKFYVAGSNPPPEIQAFDSDDVRVLGYVPDIEPFFHGSRVFVAPVRFGAGVKGKIGDALSYGLPLVTTIIGAEGMGLRHGYEVMIADDPEAFAKAVIEVYRDAQLWQRLSDDGYVHIEKHFSPEVVEETIIASIEVLGSS